MFYKILKFFTKIPNLFVRKSNSNFLWNKDHQNKNNLTIKNKNPLPLIGKSGNEQKRAKQFTQINLISLYYKMRIEDEDEKKTAFGTRYKYYKYKKILFR